MKDKLMPWTVEEHELIVASQNPKGNKAIGHLIPCSSCGSLFRTCDWPPAICKDCKNANVS